MTTRIVILGGSFAGLQAARECARIFGRKARITVVDRSPRFVFRPSLPWIVFRERRPRDVWTPMEPLVTRTGAEFVRAEVRYIDTGRNRVVTDRGPLPYDFLVIALGASSPPDGGHGLDGAGYSYLWLDEALRLRHALDRFTGGHVVIAFCPRSPLTCAAWEIAFQMDQHLRRQGLRARSTISVVSYEDQPFEWAGNGASFIVDRWLRHTDIAFYPSTFIEAAGSRFVRLADGTVLPVSLLIYIPDYAGSPVVRAVPRLTDTRGFVLVDRYMRSEHYPNIFAAGDIVSLPGPKTALMAELQGRTVARNIAAQFGLRPPEEYSSYLACLADLGVRRGLLSVRKPAPQHGGTRTYFLAMGWLPHLAKIALERYFMRVRLGVR